MIGVYDIQWLGLWQVGHSDISSSGGEEQHLTPSPSTAIPQLMSLREETGNRTPSELGDPGLGPC